VSDNGTLVYMPGSFQRTLVRVNRYGQDTPINAEPRGYRFPQSSPNGKSVAVTVDPRPSSIWVVDVATGQAEPLTTDKRHSIAPVWSPDGTRLVFNHYSGSHSNPTTSDVVWMSAQPGSELRDAFAAGTAQRMGDVSVTHWTSAAGLFGIRTSRYLRADVVQFRLGDSSATPIVSSPADDRSATLSPDGRWLAYTSNISGTNEVYVRPYPHAGASALVSTRGGTDPVWSHDGTELLYRSGSRIMAVAHDPRSSSRAFAAPKVLFSGAFDFSQERNWSVSRDGTFIMIKADPTTGRQLRVVFNWFDELTGASAR
jgi:Tol biopolymer transport system component